MSTQTTFAQELLGAEFFATQVSKTQFKISLYMHMPCNHKPAKEQQVVLFEQGTHKLVGVISLNQDSNYTNKYAPLSCKEAFDNCAQTQRYTTIFIADESRTTYDLVWAYQGIPEGLGNFSRPNETGVTLSVSLVVDGGFSNTPAMYLTQLPFLQVCENQKTTYPMIFGGKDSSVQVKVEPIGLFNWTSKENFRITYPASYTNTYTNLEGDTRYVGNILPDIGPYQSLSYLNIKANGGSFGLDRAIKINPTKQEVELIKLPKGNYIQGLQLSTMLNGMPIHSHLSLSKYAFNCSNIGNNTIVLTVTDVNGNVSTVNAQVTVNDLILPIVITKATTIYLNASGLGSITAGDVNNGSFDNCAIASILVSKTNFNCSNVGANTVTLTVTDVNGNVSSANATVVVKDLVAPVAICKNATVTLVGGSASITAANINNGSSDACGIATLSVSPSSFTCANIGNNNVVLTVTDVNGNVSTCNANVQVLGSIPSCSISSSPRNNGTVIGSTTTLAAANTLYLGYGAQTMNLTCTASGAAPFTYSWTGSNLSANNITNPVFAPIVGSNYTFTCTVTNSFGCQTTCNIVICVLDIRATGGSPSNPKVYLCYVPSGNPNNPQTLNISISAVPAHLGLHGGDRLGSCTQTCGSLKNNAAVGDLYTEGDVDLIVYPNPSTASFTFKLESESNEPIQITILDINGKLISQSTYDLHTESVVVGDELANGMYIAMVKQGDFNKTIKIQKIQ